MYFNISWCITTLGLLALFSRLKWCLIYLTSTHVLSFSIDVDLALSIVLQTLGADFLFMTLRNTDEGSTKVCTSMTHK